MMRLFGWSILALVGFVAIILIVAGWADALTPMGESQVSSAFVVLAIIGAALVLDRGGGR